MSDCIFCKIANKEIPTQAVYEDDMVIAFNDLEPQAPVHVLVIPKKHIASLLATTAEDKELLAHITGEVIPMLAKIEYCRNWLPYCSKYRGRGWPNSSAPSFPPTWRSLYAMATRLIKKSYQICI